MASLSGRPIFHVEVAYNYIWDVNTLSWIPEQQPATTGGGGGGGAVTIANGADTAEGSTTDTAVTGDNTGTISSKLRGLVKILTDVWDSVNHRLIVDGSQVTQPVSGTFWQSTQPVSIATMPSTPVTGSVSVSNFPATQTISGSVSVSNFPATQAVSIATMPSTPVTGTFWQTTQPVSATSLPLPTNAAQETGGNLATIATDVAPLVTSGAGGYIRQDSTGTIAKENGNLYIIASTVAVENGGNLASVAASHKLLNVFAAQQLTFLQTPQGGFIPQETPSFLAGF